jgi:hypothetical protein
MHPRSSPVRLVKSVPAAGLVAACCALLVAVPASAPADNPRVDIDEIKITGTPRLFTYRTDDKDERRSWVVFQTSPRLHTVRQVVPVIGTSRGLGSTTHGAPNCIRAAIGILKAGTRYSVRFYARSRRSGPVEKLLTTRSLVARTFVGSTGAVPSCATPFVPTRALPVVVTSNAPPPGENASEEVRPRALTFQTTRPHEAAEIALGVSQATWRGWGRSTTIASGRARVDVVDASFRGRATVTLDRLRPHARDGCGSPPGRVYTRARVRLAGMSHASYNGTYTIGLPRSGCAT